MGVDQANRARVKARASVKIKHPIFLGNAEIKYVVVAVAVAASRSTNLQFNSMACFFFCRFDLIDRKKNEEVCVCLFVCVYV